MSFKNSKDQSFPSATLGVPGPYREDVDYMPGRGDTREGPWDFPGGGSFALGINPNSFPGPEGPWHGTRLSASLTDLPVPLDTPSSGQLWTLAAPALFPGCQASGCLRLAFSRYSDFISSTGSP